MNCISARRRYGGLCFVTLSFRFQLFRFCRADDQCVVIEGLLRNAVINCFIRRI